MSGRRDPLEALAQRWGAAGYLVVILGTEVLTRLVGYLAWDRTGPGASAQFVVYIVGLALGLLLWRACPSRQSAAGLFRVLIIVALALWLLDAGRRLAAGQMFNPLWVAVPLLLAMIWRKPPTREEAHAVVSGVAVTFAGAVVVALFSEMAGLSGSWYAVLQFERLQAWDAAYYWLPLADVLGVDGRWAGPFLHPNHAGPIGGLLIVVGMCRAGVLRWIFLLMGFLVLLLTASRTSMIGALAGAVVVVAAAVLWDRGISRSQWFALATGTVATFIILAWSVVGVNDAATSGEDLSVTGQVANASGRPEVWAAYARIWAESPWWGVPDARIVLAVEAGELPDWAASAHNLLLDSLVRFGVVGAVLVVAVLTVTGVLAVRAAAAGARVGLGLLFVVLGSALTEAVVFWRTWGASTIILFLAVIASVGPYPPARWPKRGSRRPEATIPAAD